jgi:hypothetical protein
MALFQSVMTIHMMHTSWIIVDVISSYIDSHEAGAQSWDGRAFSVQWRNFSSHFHRMRPFSVTISISFQCKLNKISFSLLRCNFDALNQCAQAVTKRRSSHLKPTSLRCIELFKLEVPALQNQWGLILGIKQHFFRARASLRLRLSLSFFKIVTRINHTITPTAVSQRTR